MTVVSLDRLDRKILLELDIDASRPLSQIARNLRMGSDLIEYRMKRYLREGLITRLTPTINPSALGFHVFKTYLKHRMPEKARAAWIKSVNAAAHTYWLVEGYGRWDVLLSIAARDFAEYQRILDSSIGSLGEHLLDLAVYPLVEVQRFPKSYLLPGTKRIIPKRVRWKSESGRLELDELEHKLLWELSDDCRLPDTELAARLKCTPAMISHRRKKFVENGVIIGHRVQFDYAKLGMVLVKIFFEPKDYSPGARKKILDLCEEEPEITCFAQQIGTFSLEIEAEVSGYHELSSLLDRLRSSLSNIISRMEYMILTKDYYHRVPKI